MLPFSTDESALIGDAGGGSGRLLERALERFPFIQAVNIDQSEAFLGLAERRLERFGNRANCHQCRLQDDWPALLDRSPKAIVSMSAVHHLDSTEKHTFYGKCFETLELRGMLVNGDEVRPKDPDDYLSRLRTWADHMQREMRSDRIPTSMHGTLSGWIERNVENFGSLKISGDDCHETLEHQLMSLKAHGFSNLTTHWTDWMWSVFSGTKAE